MALGKTVTYTINTDMVINKALASVKQLQNGLNSLSIKDSNLKNNFKDIFAEINAEIKNYQEKLNSNFKTKSEVTGLEKSAKRINSLMEELVKTYRSVNENADLSKIFNIDSSSAKKIAELDEQIVQTKKDITELAEKTGVISKINEQIKKIGTPKAKEKVGVIKQLIQDGEFKEAEEILTKLIKSAENYQLALEGKGKKRSQNVDKNIEAYSEILKILKQINVQDLSNLDKLKADINSLETNKVNILKTALQEVYTNFIKGASGAEALANSTREYTDETTRAARQTLSLNNEIDEIKNRIGYFFSLSGSIYLFERAIRQAYESVKELDAAMTETAVVTDFSVGDMWDALPRYTAAANELGTTTLGAYETMTLFYQQGLKTNEVFEIGTETMKMARIASMDYTKATDLMTAALRGFNMELNETSAQRINDVYSELAAITAADTEEIADAMTRTASIASSAGMEFETTSAFLSQMIETTREAPENLGTAMKTIIARFQELKKAPNEIASEIDGEALDVNKIDTALKSIGVSLMDNVTGQFRELDDVFLEIASKWDGLDKNTQRYIATVAAGSRQQSRFIAMMSDYERTMELVDAANNSAGASQRQFEKTTESLESKLNKLKNAWELIMMGFANNTVIKGVVDLLTQLFTAVNNVLGVLPSGARSVVEFAAAFGMFRAIPKAFDGALKKIGKSIGTIKNEGSDAAKEIDLLQKAFNVLSNKVNMKIFSVPISDNFKEAEKDIKKYGSYLSEFYEYGTGSGADIIAADFEKKYGVKQLEAYNKAVAAGLDKQKASLLLLTKEDALKEILGKTTDELTAAELEEIAARVASGEVLNLNSVARKKLITDLLIGNKATRIAALEALGLATAEDIAAKKTGLLGKALLALPGAKWIGIITAALVGLSIMIYSIHKSIKNNTIEERLKRTQEQTEKLKTAAEDASSAYDKLLSTFEAYDEAQSILEVLTAGTEDWTKALIEANQQVLELLETYPELAKYLVSDENNQLTISEEGRREAVEKASNRVKRTQTLAFQSQTLEAQLELKLDKENLEELVIDEGELRSRYKAPDKILGEENLQKFLDTYEEYGNKLFEIDTNDDGFIEYSEELKALSQETGLSAKGLYNARNSIINYNLAIEEQAIALKAQSESLLKSNQNARAANSEYSNEIASVFAAQDFFSKENINKTSALINIDDLLTKYQLSDIGTDKENLQQIYSELTGIAVEDIDEELAKSSAKLKEAIAKIQISDQLTESMDEYAKALENATEEIAKKINAFLSNDGEGLTSLYLDEYKHGKTIGEILGEFADSLGYTSAQELANLMGYQTVAELEEVVKANVEHANEVLAEVTENLVNITGLDKSYFTKNTFFDSLTAKEAERLQGNLSNLTLKLGEETTQKFVKLINEVSEDLDIEELHEFQNLITTGNWDNINDINNIITSIEGFSSLEDVDGIVNDLKEIFIDTGYALDHISLDNLNNEIKTTQELLNDLKDKDDYKFTEEEKNKYIDLGVDPSLFSGYGDEFYYIGDSLVDLKQVLQDNIQATIENTKAETQRQLDLANRAIDVASNPNTSFDIYDWQFSTDYSERIDFLKEVGEISSETADKLSEYYDQGKLEEAHKIAIDNILADISSYIQNKPNLEQQQDQLDTQIQTYNYATQSVGNITAAATGNDVTGVNTSQTEEAATNALKQRARATQETADEVLALNQAEKKLEEVIKTGTKAQKVAAHQDVKAAKAKLSLAVSVGEFKEKLEGADSDIKEHLESLSGLKKETESYNIELGNIASILNSVFDSDLDFSFFTGDNADNLANLQKAINGDATAWEKLADAIYKAKLQSNDFITKFGLDASKVQNIVQDLDDLTFSIDGTATLDITSLVQQLLIAGANISQVAEALEELGYTEIDFNTEWDFYNPDTQKIITKEEQASQIADMASKHGKIPSMAASQSGAGLGSNWIRIPKKVTAKKISGYTGPDDFEGFGNGTKDTGGGSSNKEKVEEELVNPYDRLYNLTRKITKELRMWNKYEAQYSRWVEDSSKNTEDLVANIQKQESKLNQIINNSRTLIKERLKDANKLEKKRLTYVKTDSEGNEKEVTSKHSLSYYATYDEKNNIVHIDWDRIQKVVESGNKGLLEAIQDGIGYLEGYQDDVENGNDDIREAKDALKELEELGKEQYLEFEQRVFDAIIYREQSIIDNLSEINDSISDANQSLINTIQNNLNKIRQDRENEETESDIADKERRLAYLRQDTSGANQLAIKQLEEEIAEQKQSYTDSLIDQKLEEFTEQNDLAADQRQRQIDLMQAQLDYDEKVGTFWDEAYKLIADGTSATEGLIHGKELETLLKNAEAWEGMSHTQQMDWMTDTEEMIKQALVWLEKSANSAFKGNTLEYAYNTNQVEQGQEISYTQGEGKTQTGTVDKGNAYHEGKKGDKVYFVYSGKEMEQDAEGNWVTAESLKSARRFEKDKKITVRAKAKNENKIVKIPTYVDDEGLLRSSATNKLYTNLEISKDGIYYTQAARKMIESNPKKFPNIKFKTGGLADFTGPAWLDGTKSKPEMVLNQKDTQNFIQLKDILRDLLTNNNDRNKKSGDNYYEINIEVDSLGSDYDVEQMATKIKKMIVKDSVYRNVNAVNFIR